MCISWNDAKEFCDWFSRKWKAKVMLPTEAQWEYACRAGSDGIWPWGDQEIDAQGKANVTSEGEAIKWPHKFNGVRDGYTFTAPVGSFAANAFGLTDMIGNTAEWCSDWYAESYEGAETIDPTGPKDGKFHVLRGGCYMNWPRHCRSSVRYRSMPAGRASGFGFRVLVPR